MIFSLSRAEQATAIKVAASRHIESVARDRRDSLYKKKYCQSLAMHVLGCFGELAFCRLMGLRWDESVNRFGVGDLPNLEIKTRSSMSHDMYVRPEFDMGLICVMMIGHDLPSVTFAGWVTAGEGRDRAYRVADLGGYGKPVHLVSRSMLNHPETLAQHFAMAGSDRPRHGRHHFD